MPRRYKSYIATVISWIAMCGIVLLVIETAFFPAQVMAEEVETALSATGGDAVDMTATAGNALKKDETAPQIHFGGLDDIIRVLPGECVSAFAEDEQSGIAEFRYQIDGESWIIVDAERFEVNFEQTGVYEILIYAKDTAGNEQQMLKRIVVDEAPIIEVTLPTEVELIVLSNPIQGDVNIFSMDWEVVNQSNVPIAARLAKYCVQSDFEGDFGNSYLNLKIQSGNGQQDIALGFADREDICVLYLEKAEYSPEKEYVSSGRNAKVVCSYWGFADREFNEYLRYHKAKFRVVFVVEPLKEQVDIK